MTRSMTGFGQASGEVDGQFLTVEVSAVNGRYLDFSIRMPSAWMALDPIVRQTIRKHISRGKLNVTVGRRRTNAANRVIHFDQGVARQYLDASKELSAMLGSYETLSLNVLAQLEGVLYQEEPEEDLGVIEPALVRVLEAALGKLDAMRAAEGKALAEELARRIEVVRAHLAEVEARLPELNALYEQRLRARIGELKADAGVSEERIALEVALLAEKSDVTEETVRLKAHLDHVIELLADPEPVGRRLDFLAQEMHREVNTLGVKTRDANVAKQVIGMKSELEKFREQVQNIE